MIHNAFIMNNFIGQHCYSSKEELIDDTLPYFFKEDLMNLINSKSDKDYITKQSLVVYDHKIFKIYYSIEYREIDHYGNKTVNYSIEICRWNG